MIESQDVKEDDEASIEAIVILEMLQVIKLHKHVIAKSQD